MAGVLETEGQDNQLDLPGMADIRMAGDIVAQCRTALEASGDVVVNCAMVERVDAAVLQCLGSLATSLGESSRQLRLVERSESFDRAVELLGFEPALGGS